PGHRREDRTDHLRCDRDDRRVGDIHRRRLAANGRGGIRRCPGGRGAGESGRPGGSGAGVERMMKSEVGSRKSEGLAWTPRHSLPFVKVCGLDTAANIAVAVEAGADAIGFVHWEPSVRHRSITEIRCLAVECPVTTVLVTVDLD